MYLTKALIKVCLQVTAMEFRDELYEEAPMNSESIQFRSNSNFCCQNSYDIGLA